MDLDQRDQFLAYYNPIHDQFIRYCSTLSNFRMETEDLVQETLFIAFRDFEKIRNKDKFLHYLIRVAKFTFISAQRKKRALAIPSEEYQSRLEHVGLSPEDALDIYQLYDEIGKLPTRQSEAVILFEINGFSVKEIAQIQHSKEGAVKTRLSRARSRLTESMNADSHMLLETLKSIVL